MQRLLPWLASLIAAVLVFAPTYGLGLALSPLTLFGSWIALQPVGTAGAGIRIGAALNLVIVAVGLAISTAVWGLNGWSAAGWLLLGTGVLFSYAALSRGQRVRR